jgi:SAM-dependent methyltransferase
MKAWKPFRRDDETINEILDMVYGFQRSRALLTACELDIFSTLGTGVRTSAEISAELDTDKDATERLMNSLCAIKLLEKNMNRFSNSKLALRFLVRSKPEYMSVMKFHSYLWDQWAHLTETVKTGKPSKFNEIDDMGVDEIDAFISAVHWRSNMLAPDVIKMMELKNVNKVLDLGGGLGDYAIEFVKFNPDIDCTVYANENVMPLTIQFLKEEGFADKIKTMTGNYMTDPIGEQYDMIFLSFVLHHNSIWENIDIARKVYDALKPGGQIVVQDYLVTDDRTSPEFNSLKALEMLVNSDHGNVFTESDIWIMLKEAWFKGFQRIDTEFGTSMIFAKKGS